MIIEREGEREKSPGKNDRILFIGFDFPQSQRKKKRRFHFSLRTITICFPLICFPQNSYIPSDSLCSVRRCSTFSRNSMKWNSDDFCLSQCGCYFLHILHLFVRWLPVPRHPYSMYSHTHSTREKHIYSFGKFCKYFCLYRKLFASSTIKTLHLRPPSRRWQTICDAASALFFCSVAHSTWIVYANLQ